MVSLLSRARGGLLTFVAALWLVPALQAQQSRPALSAGRVTGELVGGTYAGIGGFLVGRFVGERLADLGGAESDRAMDRVGITTGVLVAGLATAGTVYGIGSIGDQTGDFDATYLGTGVGFVAGWALSRAILGPAERPRQGMSTAMRWTMANVIALMPSIGATVGFNSTRRMR
jgi:hypothetical protein